jgi:putative membrane protein
MQLLPTISTLFIVISAIFVGFGWYHIIRGNRDTHMKLMVTGAIFALAFFIIYVSRTLFEGNTSFGGPDSLKLPYHLFLFFHISLATIGGVLGLITLWLAYKKKFFKHKKFGRVAAIVWLLTAPTGVAVYILLYIMYPGGQTKPVIDAIFGL